MNVSMWFLLIASPQGDTGGAVTPRAIGHRNPTAHRASRPPEKATDMPWRALAASVTREASCLPAFARRRPRRRVDLGARVRARTARHVRNPEGRFRDGSR